MNKVCIYKNSMEKVLLLLSTEKLERMYELEKTKEPSNSEQIYESIKIVSIVNNILDKRYGMKNIV